MTTNFVFISLMNAEALLAETSVTSYQESVANLLHNILISPDYTFSIFKIIMVVCNDIYFPGRRVNEGVSSMMLTEHDGDDIITKQSSNKRKPVNVRKEFPETWLWTEQVVK